MKRLLVYPLFLTALGLGAQEQRIDESQSVVVVEVPVQVVRRGTPIAGLTAENFEIYDRGVRQRITRFETIDLTLTGAVAEPAQGGERVKPRQFLLFFDLFFVTRPSLLKGIAAARKMANEGLHPSDRMAVATYHPNRGVRLLTGFTTDREIVGLALEALEIFVNPRRDKIKTAALNRRLAERAATSQMTVNGETDPLMMAKIHVRGPDGRFGLPMQPAFDAAREALMDHSDGDMASARIMRHLAKLAFMKRIGTPRADSSGVLAMANDMALMTNAFKNLEGVKCLVYLSEGYSNQLLSGDVYAQMVRVQLERMLDVARLTGWAFHAVDVKGLRAGGVDASQDSMTQLALDTGGKFYRNYNDLGKAMTRLVESVSVTYLLAFEPGDLRWDGSYHRLKVKLNGVPGARIQYQRRGYHEPVRGALSADSSRIDASRKAEMIMGDAEGGLFDMDAIAAAVAFDGVLARVPVVIAVAADAFEAYGPSSTLELETYVYARAADGGIPDFFAHTLQLSPLGDQRSALEDGLRVLGELELPSGDYTLRALVYDRASGDYALKSAPVSVPNFKQRGPVLYPPLWLGPVNQGLLAREGDAAIPFGVGARKFLPVPKPTARPNERNQILVIAANPNPSLVNLSHRILAESGEDVAGRNRLRVRRGSERRDDWLFSATLQLDVKGLPPGEYRLEIVLSQSDPSVERTSVLPFTVE